MIVDVYSTAIRRIIVGYGLGNLEFIDFEKFLTVWAQLLFNYFPPARREVVNAALTFHTKLVRDIGREKMGEKPEEEITQERLDEAFRLVWVIDTNPPGGN